MVNTEIPEPSKRANERMTVAESGTIWNEFAYIPINIGDEIEQDFYFWDKEIYRFDSWHWL